jgi:hypothetical protein
VSHSNRSGAEFPPPQPGPVTLALQFGQVIRPATRNTSRARIIGITATSSVHGAGTIYPSKAAREPAASKIANSAKDFFLGLRLTATTA